MSEPQQYYKLLTVNRRHKDFTYQEGLNVDPVPFNPSGSCQPGGLYFTTLKHLPEWCCHKWPLIADVTLPPDARVYKEPCGSKWKADKLELSNIRTMTDFFDTLDDATLHELVSQNSSLLSHVRHQTEALCMAAVVCNPYGLAYAQYQTEAVCLAAVRKCGYVLDKVRTQTDPVCLAAVQQCPDMLELVHNQTEEICLAAVQQDGCTLKFVHRQTEAICSTALAQTVYAELYVRTRFYVPLAFDGLSFTMHHGPPYKEGLNAVACGPGFRFTTLEHLAKCYDHTYPLPLIADVTLADGAKVCTDNDKKWAALEYVGHHDTKWWANQIVVSNVRPLSAFFATLSERTLCTLVGECYHLLMHVPIQTKDICWSAIVRGSGMALEHVRNQDEELCLAAVRRNGWALRHIRNQTEPICLAAVRNLAFVLRLVHEQTDAICLAAVCEVPQQLEFVRKQTREICLAAVRRDGSTLVFVHEQTEEICHAALEQNPGAIIFVKIPLN
jgi:hypothetical protein